MPPSSILVLIVNRHLSTIYRQKFAFAFAPEKYLDRSMTIAMDPHQSSLSR